MKKYTRNKLAMYKTVQEVLSANGTIWEGIPAIVSTVETFNSKLGSLEAVGLNQSSTTMGVKAAEIHLRSEKVKSLERISGVLSALGKENGDEVLRIQMKISIAHLLRCPRTEFFHLIDLIILRANEYSDELILNGISAEEIAQLPVDREELNKSLYSSRKAINERKEATFMIKQLSGEIDELLKDKLDQLIKVVKESHGDFYRAYSNARIIIDFGHRSSAKIV